MKNRDERPGPDRLELLIAAGWGDVQQTRIPSDVMQAATDGWMPRRNAKKRGNDHWQVRINRESAA